jgi:hypothetical protein
MPIELTAEARALLEMYDTRVRLLMTESNAAISQQLQVMRSEFTQQINAHRTEVFGQIQKINETMGLMAVDLATVKTRLDSGDHRFARTDASIAEVRRELDARILVLENEARRTARSAARTAGIAVGAGAVGAAVLSALRAYLGH